MQDLFKLLVDIGLRAIAFFALPSQLSTVVKGIQALLRTGLASPSWKTAQKRRSMQLKVSNNVDTSTSRSSYPALQPQRRIRTWQTLCLPLSRAKSAMSYGGVEHDGGLEHCLAPNAFTRRIRSTSRFEHELALA